MWWGGVVVVLVVGVAVDARSGGGGVSPPAAQRPPNWLYCFESVRESLLDSYKNKSHKFPVRRWALVNGKGGDWMEQSSWFTTFVNARKVRCSTVHCSRLAVWVFTPSRELVFCEGCYAVLGSLLAPTSCRYCRCRE